MAITGEPFFAGQRTGPTPNRLGHEAAQAPAANTAAVATLAAHATLGWVLTGVRWSYSDDPTGGSLTITAGAISEVYPITAGGPGFLPLNQRYPINTAVVITLAAGGGSVTGAVYPTGGLGN